jgi:hypothetical protein
MAIPVKIFPPPALAGGAIPNVNVIARIIIMTMLFLILPPRDVKGR